MNKTSNLNKQVLFNKLKNTFIFLILFECHKGPCYIDNISHIIGGLDDNILKLLNELQDNGFLAKTTLSRQYRITKRGRKELTHLYIDLNDLPEKVKKAMMDSGLSMYELSKRPKPGHCEICDKPGQAERICKECEEKEIETEMAYYGK